MSKQRVDWWRFFGQAARTVADVSTLSWRSDQTEVSGERVDQAWARIFGEPMPAAKRQFQPAAGLTVWWMPGARLVIHRPDGVVEIRSAPSSAEGRTVLERMVMEALRRR